MKPDKQKASRSTRRAHRTRPYRFNQWCDAPGDESPEARRSVVFTAVFRLPRGALRFARHLLEAEQPVCVVTRYADATWTVTASVVLMPTAENLSGYHAAFARLAQRQGAAIVPPYIITEMDSGRTLLCFTFPRPSASWRAALTMLKHGEAVHLSRRYHLDGRWRVWLTVPAATEQATRAYCARLVRQVATWHGELAIASGAYAPRVIE